MKLVWVLWHDAAFKETGWHTADSIDARYRMITESAGFLVKEDKDAIVLACDRDTGDGEWRGITIIPKGMVKRKRVFRLDG